MRLLGPWIFMFVGVAIGCITTVAFTGNPLRFAPNIIAGVVGAFFGLWLRDVFDITAGGNLGGAIIAAALGALLLTIPLNLFMNNRSG